MSFIAKAAGNTASNIKFFTEAVGGDPSEKMSIHSDGMMSLRQDGTSKTYFQSSGRQGSYSSLTIVIDAHAYHSFVITVSHAGYGGVWGTAKYMGYENGSMYNATREQKQLIAIVEMLHTIKILAVVIYIEFGLLVVWEHTLFVN